MSHLKCSHLGLSLLIVWCRMQLQGIAQEVSKRSGGKQHPVVFTAAADASKYDDMERVVREAIAACGPVHALVCCQGICRPFAFDDWPLQGMKEVSAQAFPVAFLFLALLLASSQPLIT